MIQYDELEATEGMIINPDYANVFIQARIGRAKVLRFVLAAFIIKSEQVSPQLFDILCSLFIQTFVNWKLPEVV